MDKSLLEVMLSTCNKTETPPNPSKNAVIMILIESFLQAILEIVLMPLVISKKPVKIGPIKEVSMCIQSKNGLNAQNEAERIAVIKQCRSMFPLETVNFRGKVFTTGMKVRITTFQKRIIEGEIIGKNDKDILCIMTNQHIIAHELNKIEDITELAKDLRLNGR